jgi:hypothetical protein
LPSTLDLIVHAGLDVIFISMGGPQAHVNSPGRYPRNEYRIINFSAIVAMQNSSGRILEQYATEQMQSRERVLVDGAPANPVIPAAVIFL